jgi:(1->4)-alpha-D-glucan 1-alpha-D-glucosylmutase
MTRDDVITGLRVDHPDGLADPAGYLGDLAEATGDTWVVVEKILEATEQLPADWRCAGTTGYDALNQALGLLVDTAAETQLTELYGALTGEPTDWHTVMRAAKRDAVERALRPEIARLSRLAAAALGEPPVEVEKALRDLLVALPVYRVYVRPGNPVSPEARTLLTQAAATAAADSDQADLVERLPELLLDGPPEIVIRFQQTSGPVMAKGVEDTAFYRYHRLVALNEVGGDPDRFGRPPTEFHAFCAHLARNWSTTMTALSTHDTKRSEDVRARLAVISEVPDDWADAVRRWSAAAQRHRSPAGPDRNAEYLIWQTLVGAWPISAERALQYTEKATHEAKQHTAWVDPDPTYDDAVRTFLERVLSDNSITDAIAAFVARIEPAARVNRLTQKLVQLTMPGIPDIYQGTELVDLSLVDPDNRRPVDYDARRDLLRTNDDEKLHVVSTALRARRDHPEWFGADAAYTPLTATGPAAEHVIAFKRGDGAVTIATRLSERLARSDGWRDTTLALPDGPWTDLLSGQQLRGSDSVPVGDVLRALPVALLGRKASSQT